jgi:hypothetical protein
MRNRLNCISKQGDDAVNAHPSYILPFCSFVLKVCSLDPLIEFPSSSTQYFAMQLNRLPLLAALAALSLLQLVSAADGKCLPPKPYSEENISFDFRV